MSPFRFRLERALGWRRTELSREETRLEHLEAELHSVGMAVMTVRERRSGAQHAVADAAVVHGSDLASLEVFRMWALSEEARLARRGAELRKDIAQQKLAVTQARSRVRLLERLRERRHDEWKEEAGRELEALAGESAIAQWRRRAG